MFRICVTNKKIESSSLFKMRDLEHIPHALHLRLSAQEQYWYNLRYVYVFVDDLT